MVDTQKETERLLEDASHRQAGECYARTIEALISGGKNELASNNPMLSDLTKNAQIALERQQIKFVSGKYSAKRLLESSFPKERIVGLEGATLENPSTGIVLVRIPRRALEKLHPGARAVAVFSNSHIPFVLIADYDDKQITQIEDEENLPHEVHHIVWRAGRANELIGATEEDPERKRLFLSFINEVVATMVSNGKLHGHCQGMELTDELIEANELLSEIDEQLKRTDYKKTDLIIPLLEAKNMKELVTVLGKIKSELKNIAKPEAVPTNGGWTSISV